MFGSLSVYRQQNLYFILIMKITTFLYGVNKRILFDFFVCDHKFPIIKSRSLIVVHFHVDPESRELNFTKPLLLLPLKTPSSRASHSECSAVKNYYNNCFRASREHSEKSCNMICVLSSTNDNFFDLNCFLIFCQRASVCVCVYIFINSPMNPPRFDNKPIKRATTMNMIRIFMYVRGVISEALLTIDQ
jgi:hypothetical protein